MKIRHLLLMSLITQANHPPVVKIISPAPNTVATSPIRYEITVTDKEDGDSRYDEINPKEVILETRAGSTPPAGSTPDHGSTPKTGSAPNAGSTPQPNSSQNDPLESPGLAAMARSNCFNCHQFTGKGIGPSLFEIAKRPASTDTLARRIKDGSAGIWGKEKMPSHPELAGDDIRQMVVWIQKYAATPGVTYQAGLTGVLQFPGTVSPNATAQGPTAPKPGSYTLTAAYTDHGAKTDPNQGTKAGPSSANIGHLTGLDRVTLTIK